MADKNIVGWFEIPVEDMDRAIEFYQKVFSIEMQRNQLGELQMAWFPWVENGIGAAGSLVKHEAYKPSDQGTLIYFTSQTGDLDKDCRLIEDAGGKIIKPKTLIKEDIGYMAVFLDTEGNKVAMHSRT